MVNQFSQKRYSECQKQQTYNNAKPTKTKFLTKQIIPLHELHQYTHELKNNQDVNVNKLSVLSDAPLSN